MKVIRVQRSLVNFPNQRVEQEKYFSTAEKAAAYIGVDVECIKSNVSAIWCTVRKVIEGAEIGGMKWADETVFFHYILIEIE